MGHCGETGASAGTAHGAAQPASGVVRRCACVHTSTTHVAVTNVNRAALRCLAPGPTCAAPIALAALQTGLLRIQASRARSSAVCRRAGERAEHQTVWFEREQAWHATSYSQGLTSQGLTGSESPKAMK